MNTRPDVAGPALEVFSERLGDDAVEDEVDSKVERLHDVGDDHGRQVAEVLRHVVFVCDGFDEEGDAEAGADEHDVQHDDGDENHRDARRRVLGAFC